MEDGLSLSHADRKIRREAYLRLKKHIELASPFKAGVIIGLIRGNFREPNGNKKAEERFRESLDRCLEVAEDLGVDLLIEPINRYETGFIRNIDDALDFCGKVNSARLKILIDTFHMNIEEGDMVESIKRSGSKIAHIHLADNNRRYPGQGHIDFRSIAHILEEINYQGFLSFEMEPWPTVQDAALSALNYIKGCFTKYKREEK